MRVGGSEPPTPRGSDAVTDHRHLLHCRAADAVASRARRAAPQNSRVTRGISWPSIVVFLLPALALYLTFVVYPIVQSTRYSLYDWNGLEPLTDFIGIDNFRRAFSDELFRDAIKHNGDHHRPVAAAADPVRPRPGHAAQRQAARVGPCCARCSSPPTSCPRSSPASSGARSCGPTGCSTRASRRSAPRV